MICPEMRFMPRRFTGKEEARAELGINSNFLQMYVFDYVELFDKIETVACILCGYLGVLLIDFCAPILHGKDHQFKKPYILTF